jgi:hypothetical protein
VTRAYRSTVWAVGGHADIDSPLDLLRASVNFGQGWAPRAARLTALDGRAAAAADLRSALRLRYTETAALEPAGTGAPGAFAPALCGEG